MISRLSLIKVFAASFFMQSCWNYEKMQALGFAAAISPAIDEIYKDSDGEKKAALNRHMDFYNAHPYMAAPILGASIRLEEKHRSGEASADASVRFKSSVMAPYSAIGDGFFWSSIRPLASCAGILAAFFWGMWGPVIFLLAYNVFHLWMRWVGLKKGALMGEEVVTFVKSLQMPKWGQRARYAACALIGIGVVAAAWGAASYVRYGFAHGHVPRWALVFAASLAPVTLGLNELIKRGLSIPKLLYLAVLPLILYGMLKY